MSVIEDPNVHVMTEVEVLKEKLSAATAANYQLQSELTALRDVQPATNNRLASKIRSQAYALNALNRRIRTQRLVLRKLSEQGRNLSVDEWNELKNEYVDELELITPLYI